MNVGWKLLGVYAALLILYSVTGMREVTTGHVVAWVLCLMFGLVMYVRNREK